MKSRAQCTLSTNDRNRRVAYLFSAGAKRIRVNLNVYTFPLGSSIASRETRLPEERHNRTRTIKSFCVIFSPFVFSFYFTSLCFV